jgi:ferric-dicitrate binding protein FerR (iron transport regulator)
MSRRSRTEDQVRQMLDVPHPQVPADLAERAAEHGGRMLRRRRAVRALLVLVLCAAVVAFLVWAMVAEPWQVPPTETTPPLDGG